MVREGSVTRNLGALLPLVQPRHGDRVGFVTDDRLPHDLLDEGGVDCLVRGAIAGGADAAYAVRCASWAARSSEVTSGTVTITTSVPSVPSVPGSSSQSV